MKKLLAMLLTGVIVAGTLAGCGTAAGTKEAESPTLSVGTDETTAEKPGEEDKEAEQMNADLSEVEKIIQEAETMTLDQLAAKAIEESNGATFYGVGNSSRGKTALPLFIEYLQTIDSSYTMEYEWQQPKNNKIFEQLSADSLKSKGTFAMTLIQDGNQIESKMVQTGILDTFVPLDWATANGITAAEFEGFLPLQTLNKVFLYNSTGDIVFDNCWDFVAEGSHPLFMDIDSEIVGKNFLYMLTEDQYATRMKEAYEALNSEEQAYFTPIIEAVATDAADLGLGENGKYALAWIKLWVENYNAQTDDGPLEGRVGHLQPRLAAEGTLAALSVVHFVPVGIVDRAEDRPLALHCADGDGGAAATAEVVRRAVDRVDDEGQAISEGVALRLLGEEGRAGIRLRQLLQQKGLHRHVRLGDEIGVRALCIDLRVRIVQHDPRRLAQDAVKSLVHRPPPDAG